MGTNSIAFSMENWKTNYIRQNLCRSPESEQLLGKTNAGPKHVRTPHNDMHTEGQHTKHILTPTSTHRRHLRKPQHFLSMSTDITHQEGAVTPTRQASQLERNISEFFWGRVRGSCRTDHFG